MEEKRLKLNEVSEGLRQALERGRCLNCRRAKGVGADGTKYDAAELYELVCIEELPYHPLRTHIPEPEGVVWKPVLGEVGSVRLEEISEGLRKALNEGRRPDGQRRAVGVGLDGMRYVVTLRDDSVYIWEDIAGVRISSPISEPEDVIWKPVLPNEHPITLDAVSEGLRKALTEARWPDGRRLAAGVGPDGMQYDASLHHGLVSICETLAYTSFGIAIPEPEGVVWKPILTKQDWVKLKEVSEGLRKALEKREGFLGQRGLAEGVGPDGTEYQAAVWHRRLVCIDFAEIATKADGTLPLRVPMPEPDRVVWKPMFPSIRRPWWQVWK
jgi:hypothetical protein